MLLYKTTYQIDRDGGSELENVTVWGGSQTESSKQRTAAKDVAFKKPITATVDVPTNKAGLIAWLNLNAA